MSFVRHSDNEPIALDVKTLNGNPYIGATGVIVRVRRNSDGFYLDWADSTYKSASWITLNQSTSPVDPTNAPGIYQVPGGYPTPLIANAVKDDHYLVLPDNSGAPDTEGAVLPPPHEFRVGFWMDAVGLDCVVSATIGSEIIDTLKLIAWLEKQNEPVSTGLVSATIELRDATGASVVPATAMSGPDAQGVFRLDVPMTSLQVSSNYYASVSITDTLGTTTAYTATPTVG